MRFAPIVLAILLGSGAVGSQSGAKASAAEPRPFDRDCMDDYGRDLCDPIMRARIRDKFGVPPAETLAAKGVEGVRVFLVDGYSNDMPLVSILRQAGGDATLEVRAADKPPRLLSTPASAWDWVLASALSDLVRAAPERATPPAGKAGPAMCLHAWVTVTEAIHAGNVTTRIRHACADGPIFEGGASLTRIAIDSFEGCAELMTRRYGGPAAQLSDCTRVRGGYMAVGLYNAFNDSPAGPGKPGLAATPDSWLTKDVRLTWAGRDLITGSAAVAAFWEEQTNGGHTRTLLTAVDPTSEAGVYLVRGFVRLGDGAKGQAQAPFEQAWRIVPGAGWRVTEWAVGAFEPVSEGEAGL